MFPMGLIVQKFGGSSVADVDRLRNVARIITDTYQANNNVVVVLSAQGDTTDDLIAKAVEINPNMSKRELDMLLSTGEQISCALCAMAIEAMGYPVVSLTGWQAGIQSNSTYGNARIKRVMTERIQNELDRRSIVIVTGFQGINKYGDITTLGRGGSDTSAVALAAAVAAVASARVPEAVALVAVLVLPPKAAALAALVQKRIRLAVAARSGEGPAAHPEALVSAVHSPKPLRKWKSLSPVQQEPGRRQQVESLGWELPALNPAQQEWGPAAHSVLLPRNPSTAGMCPHYLPRPHQGHRVPVRYSRNSAGPPRRTSLR